MPGSMKNQWRVTAWLDTIGSLVVDQSTGGAAEWAEKKYREGGARDKTVLTGTRTLTNVVCERLFRGERDGLIIKGLLNNAGGKAMTVSKQPLDEDGNDYGEAILYTGKCIGATPPDTDSDDVDGVTKLIITLSTASVA